MLKPHFIALLHFISEKEGGRKTPISSGYRTGIKFSSHGEFILGEHNFIDTDLVFSGDTVNAEITIIDFEKLNGKLYTGLDFDFYEGEILMGKGVVTKILNKDLE
jgi:translation elongation factor EF-Tu-like GTPase